MAVIAVAGGSGGVGKTIVEALLQESSYKIIVLTRSDPKPDPVLQQTQQVQINYNDITSVSQALDNHAVDTIISAISIFDAETSQSQLNLIQAAERSSVTKRFIPSEYSFIQTKELLSIDPSIQFWLDAADMLQKSNLKYTRVIPGFFMDYWGMPGVKSHLQPITFGINIAECQAAIPGDGNDAISMTYTYDMAAYIVKLLRADDWTEFSIIQGDKTTYNEILEQAETIRGKKFEVVYDSADKVNAGPVTVPPMPEGIPYSAEELQEMTALVGRLTVAGVFNLPDESRVDWKFPEVQPVKVRELLRRAWGGQ